MTAAAETPWQCGQEGVEPAAEGPAVRVRVRALPANGEANAAAGTLLAAWLGIAKSQVSLRSGAKSRVKSFAIAGEEDELALLLALGCPKSTTCLNPTQTRKSHSEDRLHESPRN